MAFPAGDGAPLDPRTEKTIWIGRTHWMHYSGTVLIAGLLIVVLWLLIALVGLPGDLSGWGTFLVGLLVTAVIALAAMVRVLVKIIGRRYRLTGQRLFIEKGVLSQTIDQTELIRVDDVRVKKTFTDRLFGLGTVEVLSTDATDQSIMVRGVRDADQIAEHVRLCVRSLRSRSLFVEKL